MGKLHTIRRAVERDPRAFVEYRFRERIPYATGAYRFGKKGDFKPCSSLFGNKRYVAFIRKVLNEIHDSVGIADVGEGVTIR